MARTKPSSPRRSHAVPSRRKGWKIAFWLMLPAVAALVWFWQPLNHYAVTSASYGARVACPCRFIAGRDLSQCRDDFEAGMWPILLSEDVEAKSVTATFPLLSRQTATWSAGHGCVLEGWEN